MLPYGRQDVSEADIQAVVAVLRSDFLTQGPALERFEAMVADTCGARYAVAVNSATSALHLACLAAGLGPGDWLWTSPITFVASANCALYCGAQVDFVDIDPRTYNLSVDALREKLAWAEQTGRLPKVIIPVHLAGQPCEMAEIAALSKQYGVTLIEDASHAIGARYRGQPVGNGEYAAMTVFSFHPVKIVTTGEGGMVLTNDPALRETLALLRSHGITRDVARMTRAPEGLWYYQQLALGFNYRMTDIQAALGASQMERLGAFIARRRELAGRYAARLQAFPLRLPFQHLETASAWHLYIVRLRLDELSRSHPEVFRRLREAGIGVNLHYIPVHYQPYYANLGFSPGDFPEAERYYGEALSLPLYPAMTDADQDGVLAALADVLDVSPHPGRP